MILARPGDDEPVDQGDIIDGCPIFKLGEYDPAVWPPSATVAESRLIVLAQTCDLAQRKSKWTNLAAVHPVQDLITRGVLKPADVRGPIRSGRVFGWYFRPNSQSLALPEWIVDFGNCTPCRLQFSRPFAAQASVWPDCSRSIASTSRSTSRTPTAGSACRCRTRRIENL